MKVCILTHTFPRFQGDVAAPFMDGVASGIAEAGNQVFVLTPFSQGFKKNSKNKNYKVVTYKYIFPDLLHKIGYSETLKNDMSLKWGIYLLSPFFYLFGLIALLKLISKKKIQIINAHWILPNGFIAALANLFTNVPLVITLPGSDVYMAQKNTLFGLMAKLAFNRASVITSNSPQLLNDLEKLGADRKKFSTIIYGVDPQNFKPNLGANKLLRKELNIPKDKLIVLGVGRLVAKKGFKYLVEAISKIIKKKKNILFLIVGDGDQRQELESLAAKLSVTKYIKFTGVVNYRKLNDFYNLADIFILPSIRDDQGNLDDQSVAIVEAMAAGLPIITTNFPGYKIVVENGKNGFLTDPRNSSQIASSITKMANSIKLRQSMGTSSRKMVLENFSWSRIGLLYNGLFKQILAKRNSQFYSEGVSKILEEKDRLRIAKQIYRILEVHLGNTKKLSCLDIGCSSGVITNYLAPNFKIITGVDIDQKAVALAKKNYTRKNLKFLVANSENLEFKENSFDVVICNQVYNFVDNPPKLLEQIYRVLKPGGVCFFSARNKYALIEPQYNLPFLSWFPEKLAVLYLTLSKKGKNFFGKNYLSFWGLKNLVSKFQITDYTVDILKNPTKYGFKNLEKYSILAQIVPLTSIEFLIPNFIWVLTKPKRK